MDISCQFNEISENTDDAELSFATPEIAASVSKFHHSIPGYKPTPLVTLSALANRLGVAEILVKDESQRFDLNAFKVLGASYAIAKMLGKKLGIKHNDLTFDNLYARRAEFQDITFVTATDGNHGRAVAWAANKLGCRSVVYMPKGSSPARLDAIKRLATDASITTKNYDDTVAFAESVAIKNNWILLQDTAWEGYEEVPLNIMQGYFSLITEYMAQTQNILPTHVFLQAGVGSYAASIVAILQSIAGKSAPKCIVVESNDAACLYESNKQGQMFRVEGDMPTIMAGLACGEPSYSALPVLNSGASAFIKCDDDVAQLGMRVLGNPLNGDERIVSGESGAVTLGLVYQLLSNESFAEYKDRMGITKESIILLISTEGDTDPDAYRDIVWSL